MPRQSASKAVSDKFAAFSDPTRLRIVALLERDELSVNELQQITRLGQSRISTHLGQLQEAGLIQSRREGKRTFYKLNGEAEPLARDFILLAIRSAAEMPDYADDQVNLKRILARRHDQAQLFFDQIAGRFDRSYGPGRSWQAFGQMLLRTIPPLVVADLGAGEGLLSELLARRAKKVIAVDNSEKIVAFGAAKAKKNGIKFESERRTVYNVEQNLWGNNIQLRDMKDTWEEPPKDTYILTSPPEDAPAKPASLEIEFRQGIPEREEIG
jgi:ArsR family transcriptional regulator